jgi:hypothetical protein
MVALAALFALSPSVVGMYSWDLGIPGSGGIRTALGLGKDGNYRYERRRCFTDIQATGKYSVKKDELRLAPPITSHVVSPGSSTLFFVAPYKGRLFLLTRKERTSFFRSVRRGEKPGSLPYLSK